VNYRDPYNIRSAGQIPQNIKVAFRLLTAKYRAKVMTDASFETFTGMNPAIIKVVLDIFRRKEIYSLHKKFKSYISKGAVTRGRPADLIQGFITLVNTHPDKIHTQYREQVKTLLKNAKAALVNAQVGQNQNLQAFKAQSGNVNGLRGAMKAANLLSRRKYTFKRSAGANASNNRGFAVSLGIGRNHPGGSKAPNSALMNRMFAFQNSKNPNTMSGPELAWKNLLETIEVRKNGQVVNVALARQITSRVLANTATFNRGQLRQMINRLATPNNGIAFMRSVPRAHDVTALSMLHARFPTVPIGNFRALPPGFYTGYNGRMAMD
jgi:hypothetical protein